VLSACQRAGTVTRVVLTSSTAAITDEPENDGTLTERDWNDKSSLEQSILETMDDLERWKHIPGPA
jgi:dihydroflavonol-4-reductase